MFDVCGVREMASLPRKPAIKSNQSEQPPTVIIFSNSLLTDTLHVIQSTISDVWKGLYYMQMGIHVLYTFMIMCDKNGKQTPLESIDIFEI